MPVPVLGTLRLPLVTGRVAQKRKFVSQIPVSRTRLEDRLWLASRLLRESRAGPVRAMSHACSVCDSLPPATLSE